MNDVTYLAHHGVTGQRHGVRQWQNKDGSLTPAGRIHYGVGAARSAAKTVGKVVKNTYQELRTARREAKSAQRIRSDKKKRERSERAEAHRQELIERKRRALMAKQSKKTLREIEGELSEQRLERSRKKVSALLDKRNRIKEQADLKEYERQLKRDMKKFKKDAEKEARRKYSKNKIRNMTDQEIDERLNRLKKEAQLVAAEADRNTPAAVKLLRDAAIGGLSEGTKVLAKDAVSKLGGKLLEELGSTQSESDMDKIKSLTDKLQAQLNYRKAQDALSDYKRDRTESEASRDQDRADDDLRKAALRAENQRKIADAQDHEEERAYKARTRDQDRADDELRKAAQRADNQRKIADARDYEDERAYKARTRDQDRADEELRKAAQRAENQRKIADSQKPKDGSESDAKRIATAITKRKELERRASAWRSQMVETKDGKKVPRFSYAEIADFMGLTEDQVKRLLYTN